MTKELVVSYYKENLNWLNKVKDYKITVYNKSDVEIPNTIKLSPPKNTIVLITEAQPDITCPKYMLYNTYPI